ncbi:hypothetical protein D3C71_2064510 [compost metagenome]
MLSEFACTNTTLAFPVTTTLLNFTLADALTGLVSLAKVVKAEEVKTIAVKAEANKVLMAVFMTFIF